MNYVLKSVNQLEKAGADFIVLPCNTLHALLPELKQSTKLEIINMVDEVCKSIKKGSCAGVLGSTKTAKSGIYENHGFRVVYPKKQEQERLSEIIIRIIRKRVTKEDGEFVINLIENLKKRGCEKVILGCTDLSNLKIYDHDVDILDSTEILIERIKEKSKTV